MLSFSKRSVFVQVSSLSTILLLSCGKSSKGATVARAEVKKETAIFPAAVGKDDFDPMLFNADGTVKLPENVVVPAIAGVACEKPKSSRDLVAAVYQDLLNRPPTTAEGAVAAQSGFDYADFVDKLLASPSAEDGYTKFVSGLFKLESIQPTDPKNPNDVQVSSELRKEPVTFVNRNKEKPWPWFWKSRKFFCNDTTAPLYGLNRLSSSSFVECTMPEERSGFMGMVSVLRASSPSANPQAFYNTNNNYHRVAAYVYWTTGVILLQATNGPAGNGELTHLNECVPTTDMRIKPAAGGAAGLVFGSAAIPLSGSVCSGCHSKYHGPLSIAFRRFGEKGETIELEDIDKLPDAKRNTFDRSYLKEILAEQDSCWNPDGKAPPKPFVGIVGLSEVTSQSNKFGEALGIQVPQLMGNIASDDNMKTTIAKTYYEEGQTLKSAFKGYFLSNSYKCEVKK
jgi:hypothetical protein